MRGRAVRRAGPPALSGIVLPSHARGEPAVDKLRSLDRGARALSVDPVPGDIAAVAM